MEKNIDTLAMKEFVSKATGIPVERIDLDSYDEEYVKKVMLEYGSFENYWNFGITKLNDAHIESNMKPFIMDLNKHGLHTAMCCSGHEKGDDMWVYFNTYIAEDMIEEYMENYLPQIPVYRVTEVINGYGVSFLKLVIFDEYRDVLKIDYDISRRR